MKFHKTYTESVPLTVPRGPSQYDDLPCRGRLSLVEAYASIKEKELMVVPPRHAILRSGVPVTRLKLYLRGEKASWWCVKKAKRVIPSDTLDPGGHTFGPFSLCKGSKKKEERAMVVNCGFPRGQIRRKRLQKLRSVNPRQPAPRNKKWVMMDGRATLQHMRGPRRKKIRATGDLDNAESDYVKMFSEGVFSKYTDKELDVKVKQKCVTISKEERLRGLANRGNPLDGTVVRGRTGKKKSKSSVPRENVKTIPSGPVGQDEARAGVRGGGTVYQPALCAPYSLQPGRSCSSVRI